MLTTFLTIVMGLHKLNKQRRIVHVWRESFIARLIERESRYTETFISLCIKRCLCNFETFLYNLFFSKIIKYSSITDNTI